MLTWDDYNQEESLAATAAPRTRRGGGRRSGAGDRNRT